MFTYVRRLCVATCILDYTSLEFDRRQLSLNYMFDLHDMTVTYMRDIMTLMVTLVWVRLSKSTTTVVCQNPRLV